MVLMLMGYGRNGGIRNRSDDGMEVYMRSFMMKFDFKWFFFLCDSTLLSSRTYLSRF